MDPLQKRALGKTDIELTRLGLGGTGVGSLYARQDDAGGAATVRRAFELGLRYFDTAPFYGHGSSERRFGAVLSTLPRADFVLSTKVGRLLVPAADDAERPPHFKDEEPFRARFDYSRDAVLRSLEESRARLGIDTFDILYIHDCQDHVREALDGAYPVLDEMRARGEVRAIGAGLNHADVCLELARNADFDCFLLANRYTLLEQSPLDDLLPLCEARGIGIVAGGPFNSGILATGPVAGATYNYRPAAPEALERVRAIESVCAAFDVPLAAAALQFPLAHPAVSSVICGARSAEEIAANAELVRTAVPAECWRELKGAGLIREDAPTPAAPD